MTLIHCRRKLQLFHFQTVLENNSLQEIGLKFLSHLWIVLKMDHLRLSEDPRMFWQGNHSDHFLQLQPACSTILKLSRLKTWSISTDSLSRVGLRMLANELKQENELHTLTLLLWLCSTVSQQQVRRVRRRRAASLRASQNDQTQHGAEWFCITRTCSLQQGSKWSCIKYERREATPLCFCAVVRGSNSVGANRPSKINEQLYITVKMLHKHTLVHVNISGPLECLLWNSQRENYDK